MIVACKAFVLPPPKQPDVKVVELGTDLAGGSKIEIYMICLNKSNVYYLHLESI